MSEENTNPTDMQDFLSQTQQAQPESNPLSSYMRTPQIYFSLPSKGKYYGVNAIDMPINGELPVLSMSTRDVQDARNLVSMKLILKTSYKLVLI